ncbi:hypothetical protein PILCRDRAFT_830550, partial [Piloderma croceum F 1598]
FTRRAPNRATTARFRPFSPNRLSLASRLRTQRPTAATASSAPPHHPPSPFSIPISNGAPEIKPQRLDFGFLALGPLSGLAFANAMPHHHHNLISTTAPPPFTALHPHFQRRARTQAPVAQFRVLTLN